MRVKLILFVFFVTFSLSAQTKYWVTFTDKPTTVSRIELKKIFPEAVLAKKEKSGLDWYDYPVNENYKKQLSLLGFVIQSESRYFNSVTLTTTADKINQIKKLPYVKSVSSVVRFKPSEPDIEAPSQTIVERRLTKVSDTHVLEYGQSATQVNLTKISNLHDLDITGFGLSVGLIDEGTKVTGHEAFESLQLIEQKNFVVIPPGDPAATFSHGTATLSLMGGYLPGKLIGGTFNSQFYLAESEYGPASDYAFEEDNLVSAIEWMEAQGVDVVNISLGYLDFIDKTSYRFANGDLNGKTALGTKAADIAALKGVGMFIAMGNEGNSIGTTGSLSVPADGFYVFSSGAVNSSGTIASFSSRGPTNDGRIKPDAVSMGVSNYYATAANPNKPTGSYTTGNGTSFASPMSANAGALILSVYPELTSLQLNDVLRQTANNANSPNKDYGWGLIDAEKALYSVGPAVSNQFTISYSGNQMTMTGKLKWDDTIDAAQTRLICYKSPTDSVIFSNPIFNGNEVTFSGNFTANTNDTIRFKIIGKTVGSKSFSYPKNPDFMRRFIFGQSITFNEQIRRNGNHPRSYFTTIEQTMPQTFSVSSAYPNPFNPETQIRILAPTQADYTFEVFNLLGQKIYNQDGILSQGENYLRWNTTLSKVNVTSGIYFFKVTSNHQTQTVKAVLIK